MVSNPIHAQMQRSSKAELQLIETPLKQVKKRHVYEKITQNWINIQIRLEYTFYLVFAESRVSTYWLSG